MFSIDKKKAFRIAAWTAYGVGAASAVSTISLGMFDQIAQINEIRNGFADFAHRMMRPEIGYPTMIACGILMLPATIHHLATIPMRSQQRSEVPPLSF
jgi:hypothetical protein